MESSGGGDSGLKGKKDVPPMHEQGWNERWENLFLADPTQRQGGGGLRQEGLLESGLRFLNGKGERGAESLKNLYP